MSSDTDAIALMCMCSVAVLIVIAAAVVTNEQLRSKVAGFFSGLTKKKSGSTGGGGGNTALDVATGTDVNCVSGWCDGYATWYQSYPPCCKDSPNYDPKASKEECEDYSGCKWMGQFAGVDKKLSYDEVKSRNIVSFFDEAHQGKGGSEKWWRSNVKNKKLTVRNPSTGKTMVVEALDTCGNDDCDNCCSTNAKKGGGYLIDMEINTAKRFWGAKVPDGAKLQWKWS